MQYSLTLARIFFASLLASGLLYAEEPAVAKADDGAEQSCPPADSTPNRITIKNDPEAPQVNDLNREFKDFGTKFVVQEFFKSQDTLFNFLKLVYQTINTAINDYKIKNDLEERSIFFMFKGGNVMRIIANGVFDLLAPEARDLLKGAYGEFFTRSDADFSVFIDEQKLKNLDYDKVLNDLTELTYQSLNTIRDEFTANPEKYFNFTQLKTKFGDGLVAKYFEKLQANESTQKAENELWYGAKFKQLQLLDYAANPALQCRYEGQRDVLFDFGDKKETKIIGTALTDKSSWIQDTVNRTLTWPAERDPTMKVKFHLVRAKVAFEYTYTTKSGKTRRKAIGGELIDVSFPHRDDFRLANFLKNYDKWVADYTLTLAETGEVLDFKAESIEGIAADINEIIFLQRDRPWSDPKYEKRLNRQFFFGMTEMLGVYGVGSEKTADLVAQIRAKIVEPLKGLYPLNDEASKATVEKVESAAKAIGEQFADLPIIGHLLTGITTLVKTELVGNPKEEDAENFAKFLAVVEKNLDIMSKLANLPAQNVDIKKVYNAKMEHFL